MSAFMLSGQMAAGLASSVYALRTNTNIPAALASERSAVGLFSEFKIDNTARRFEGLSGAGLKVSSGFGLLLQRQGQHRQGEYVLALRGTDTGADWLSNANVSLERGPGGFPVHAGFMRVFKSIEAQVDEALRGKSLSRLHVVGHSLGGALASLFAAKFKARRDVDVGLYTFGCPRVGLSAFADTLGDDLGVTRIKRIYDRSDVVPMIPIFPFQHGLKGACMINGGFFRLSKTAHSMVDSYIPAMPQAGWPIPILEPRRRSIDYWLSQAEFSGSYLSSLALEALGRALGMMLEAVQAVIGIGLVGAATMLDDLASALMMGVRALEWMGDHLIRFAEAAMAFLGRKVDQGIQIGVVFLRYVLGLLFNTLAAIARSALP